MLGVPPKSAGAIDGGLASVCSTSTGMSEIQRRFAAQRRGGTGEPELHPDDRGPLPRSRERSSSCSSSGTSTRPTPTSWATWASRVLADREDPGRYLIVADFGVVDPDVSAAEEAERNNDAARDPGVRGTRCATLVDGEPVYHHYDELYRTDR